MMDSGKEGGPFTGQRAESLGLILNALRFGLRAAVVWGPERGAEESALAARALLLASRIESRRVVVSAESAGGSGGVLRGIKIARGLQSWGWASQSCKLSAVWAEAPAGALPQPISQTVANAAIVVERNMRITGEWWSMSLGHLEHGWKAPPGHNLQSKGQISGALSG
jgi:hypothetical protein